MPQYLLHYLSGFAKAAVSIWFVVWSIRRRGEFDIKLSMREQFLRWAIVGLALGLGLLPGANITMMIVRVVAGITGLAFVAWPNLGHHTMALGERLHLVRGREPTNA